MQTSSEPGQGSEPIRFYKLIRKGGPARNADPYWIDRWFFRPWTVYLSWVFVKLGWSANFVTLLSAVSLVVGSVLLCFESNALSLIGVALVVLYAGLDCCDGEVARYYRLTGQTGGGRDGSYWDNIVHGLEPVLVGCLAYRLYLTSGMGVWPLVVAAIDTTALCVAPWQRCCEIIVSWVKDRRQSGVTDPLGDFELPDDDQDAASSDMSLCRKWFAAVKQLLLFPGYFVTLPMAVILDLVVGPISLTDGASQPIVLYWIALWLLQHAVGKVLAAVRSTRRYALWLSRISP